MFDFLLGEAEKALKEETREIELDAMDEEGEEEKVYE
jgi:hypothetical protein